MPLAPDRLARLAQLIDQLQAQDAARRADWLSGLSAADADLLPHLQSLLDTETETDTDPELAKGLAPDAAQDPAPGPSDTLWRQAPVQAFAALQRTLGLASEPVAGQRIGPWRLLAPLGRGGMGVVWRAERCDGAFQRQVALKLPLTGPAPARLVERFARERDILAALSHPHIARLYDAGVSDAGQPYMALELIEGESMHLWADRHKLGLRARVGLLLQVLQAVQHAHQRLVVHRDLKPSNILVGADGQVHLLDFGIARLLDDGMPAPVGTPEQSEFGTAAMTPTYAAPEQIEHKPVTTAADVYSLGVVAYELLAGSSPYRPTHASRYALEQSILAVDPDPPSTATNIQAAAARGLALKPLRRQLHGDLDAILLKALRKQPAERYDSADAMAQDLQRWLGGLPVLARRDSAAYRIAKFLHRYRVASAAAGVALLALVTGAGLALWQAGAAHEQARRADSEAANARRELQRAEAAQSFMIEMWDAADPARAQGRDPTVRELMARAEQMLPQRLASQPELASNLRGALADIFLKLADGKHALSLADARVAELRGRPGVQRAELGAALVQLGLVQVTLGRYKLAVATYEEAERLLAPPATTPLVQAPLAYLILLERLARAMQLDRRWPEAQTRMLTVLPALEARLGPGHSAVLEAEVSLIDLYFRLNQRAPAAALIARVGPELESNDPARAMEIARLRGAIARSLSIDGQWAAAERLQQQALADLERLVGSGNSISIELLLWRAQALDTLGRVRETDAALEQLVALSRRFHGDDDLQTALAESYRVAPLIKLGRMAEAEAAARQALAMAGTQPSVPADERLGMQRRLGLALLFNGRAAQAAALLDEVAAGEGTAPQWPTAMYRAATQLSLGQAAMARQTAGTMVRIMASKRNPWDRYLGAKAKLNLALALAAEGRTTEAMATIDVAQVELADALPTDTIEQTWPLLIRAQVLRQQHRDAEAAALDSAPRERWRAEGVLIPERIWLVH